MNHLVKQQDSLSADATDRLRMGLDSLMINLSPIDADFINKICEEKAEEILLSKDNLARLVENVQELVGDWDRNKTPLTGSIDGDRLLRFQIDHLVQHAQGRMKTSANPKKQVVAALIHLINPFDAVFDNHHRGFEDDKEAIEAAYELLDHNSENVLTNEDEANNAAQF